MEKEQAIANRTALITGGSGYLGSHLSKKLKQQGWKVIILDRKIGPTHSYVDSFYCGDVRNRFLLEDIFKNNLIDVVFHLAGRIEVGESVKYPTEFWDVNVGGTVNVLNVMKNYGVNKIIFSSTAGVYWAGAIQIPAGSSAQRPGSAGNVDLVGMIRYNTTSNNLEFCTASGSPGTYTVAGSEFTVIETNSFNGDGSDVTFTLSSASTTAGTLVMVNGVVQIPATAYSVTGTTLTFTEAPAVGDVVDARTLVTTATVSSLASASGFNTFDVSSATYANITAGTSAATVRVSVDSTTGKVTFTNDVLINGSLTVLGDSNGNINIGNETGDRLQLRGKTVYDQTAINVPDTNLKELDSYSTSAFTTARYTVQVKNGGSVSAAELIVSHDTAQANIATYAVLSTIPGTFQANISGATVKLFYTPSGAQNANIKLLTTYIV